MSRHTSRLFVAVILLAIAACGPSPEEAARLTAAAWTATPQPTSTNTPTPTSTSTPTSTPTPPPDPWGDILVPGGEAIQIAFVGDLSGPEMESGTLMLEAANLAVEDYGQLGGFSIEFLSFDDQCNATAAESVKDQVLANSQIVGVIGLNCPEAAIAELPFFEAAHLVVLASGVTQPGLGQYAPSVWTSISLDDDQLASVAGIYDMTNEPSYQAFSARFEAQSGATLGESGPKAAATYDSTMILLDAIAASNWVDTSGALIIGRQAVGDAVRSTWAYEGASGYVSIEDDGGRVQPIVPDPWGDVVVAPGEKIQLAVLEPSPAIDLSMAQGASLAVEDFGPIQGFGVEVTPSEYFCNEPGVQSAAPEITAKGNFVGVIGPLCTLATITALPVLEAAHVVMISPGATGEDLSNFGPNVFNRVILSDRQQNNAGFSSNTYLSEYVLELDSVKAFLARFAEWAGFSPEEQQELWAFYAYSYDATGVLLSAIQRVARFAPDGSLVIGRQALANAVRATQNFEGVTGSISLDSKGNRVP